MDRRRMSLLPSPPERDLLTIASTTWKPLTYGAQNWFVGIQIPQNGCVPRIPSNPVSRNARVSLRSLLGNPPESAVAAGYGLPWGSKSPLNLSGKYPKKPKTVGKSPPLD